MKMSEPFIAHQNQHKHISYQSINLTQLHSKEHILLETGGVAITQSFLATKQDKDENHASMQSLLLFF